MLPPPFLAAAFFAIAAVASALNSDGLSLLALKAAVSADPNGALATWSDSDSDPCGWDGVTCTRRRVTGLVLTRRGLSGYIPSQLGAVSTLRRLSLAHNNFSQPIPTRLFNLTALIYLDLSDNALAGPLPTEIGALQNLTHLDLSSNLLNGSLPERLSSLRSLAGTMNFSCNLFTGEVPPSYGNLPVAVSLDLRRNNLTGEIPQVGSLLNQGPTAFTENPTLCGFPLQTPCPGAQNHNPNFVADPVKAKYTHPPPHATARDSGKEGPMRNGGAVSMLLISGASLAAVVAVLVSAWLFRKKGGFAEGKMGRGKKTPKEVEEEAEDVEGQMGKYVVVDKEFGLELEDLLGATAHMVSKSRSGILYKVLVARGCCARPQLVAVRRLSESGDAGGKWRMKEFAAEVDAIGRVRHPNLVPLRAYYYASNEKLLVSDFIGNGIGSLYTVIHGEGVPSSEASPPLTWAARLKIAQGMARGLTHIHECGPQKYVHGNVKTSKILLDGDLQPYISGFGLSGLVSGTSSASANPLTKKRIPNQLSVTAATGSNISAASSSATAYVAPEAWSLGSKLTQKCDVYSFGIVLLEILTGREPGAVPENDGKRLESLVRRAFREERPLSEIIDPRLLPEVKAKNQAVAVFHVALNCTETDPRLRPRMRAVVHSLDNLKLHCEGR